MRSSQESSSDAASTCVQPSSSTLDSQTDSCGRDLVVRVSEALRQFVRVDWVTGDAGRALEWAQALETLDRCRGFELARPLSDSQSSELVECHPLTLEVAVDADRLAASPQLTWFPVLVEAA